MTSKLSHECRGDNDLSGFNLDMHVTMKASVFSFYKGENRQLLASTVNRLMLTLVKVHESHISRVSLKNFSCIRDIRGIEHFRERWC